LLDFVTQRKWFFLLSGLIIIAGIIALAVSGLNLGIEFSSGTTMTMLFQNNVAQADLRTSIGELGYSNAIIQHSAQDAFVIQNLALSPVQSERDQQESQLVDNLQTKFNTTIQIAEFSVGGNTTSGNATSGNQTLGNETQGNVTSGNTTLALIFGSTVGPSDLSSELTSLGYTGTTINQTTLDSYLVRTQSVSTQQKAQIQQTLQQKYGPMNYLGFSTISPEVSGQRVKYNIYAIIAAAAAILLYMAWAFRKLANPFLYGTCAIVALLHDVLIMLAVFAIFRIEVDSMFIIAILTIIGFGVNNVIVVFDRLRESKVVESRFDLATRVNMGITETITRSINTSLTVLFTLFALYAFGGSTIHTFILALIVGVIASTYSSLFIAGQLLVSWERGDFGKLFRWLPIRRQAS
jgi:preprotein translocase subunit SecF